MPCRRSTTTRKRSCGRSGSGSSGGPAAHRGGADSGAPRPETSRRPARAPDCACRPLPRYSRCRGLRQDRDNAGQSAAVTANNATQHSVVVAGGGPTGLMLAAELKLAGVDVAVVERRMTQEVEGSRAGGLHARTIEELDQRGVAERFLSEGTPMQVAAFAMIPLDISDFPTRHNYGLALRQSRYEEILADWVNELGVTFYRGRDVTDVTPNEDWVDLALSTGQRLSAQYLVGCDGGRSLVRKKAGIDFPGWDPSTSALIAEVQVSEEPELGFRMDDKGVHAIGPIGDGRMRMVIRDEQVVSNGEPTLADLSAALISVRGTDYGVHSPTWISRFTDMTRQAATYRKGRVLLAGDAAHIHWPVGGQGLNIGVQDAVNLGWKLAQVVKRQSPDALLDSYHEERHPIAARVLQNTMAQTTLQRSDPRTDAVRNTLSDLLSMDEPRKRFAAMMSGLDIRYDLGEGHPLLGRRMPDLDLSTSRGSVRVYTLLHQARPVLLNFGRPASIDAGQWAARVDVVQASYDGSWELPVIGSVTAPSAVLIRPDGYVAWVGDAPGEGLHEALTKWLGPGR